MFTLSNVLSLLRAPLAFLFLMQRADVRTFAVGMAAFTDYVDGYLARRYKFTTRFGAILDPLMDKFFVFFILTILFYENAIQGWEIVAMLSRDIALFIFALYLLVVNRWRKYNYHSMFWGKISTSLQFGTLLFLSLKMRVPSFIFVLFFVFALFALGELFFTLKTNAQKV